MKIVGENIREIYNALGDTESREIFVNRLLYSLTNDEIFIDRIIRKYVFPSGINHRGVVKYLLYGWEKYENLFPVVVYGCGEMGKKIYDEIGDKISCFCDKKSSIYREGFCGKKVISPQQLIEKKNSVRVLIGSIDYYMDIYQFLKENEVKLIYDNINLVKMWRKIVDRQYFDRDIIRYEKEEIFIDGGSLNYATVKQFLKECNTVKKVFAFEPDHISACRCREEAKKLEFYDYEIIEKGLYKETALLHFNNKGNGCSSIDETGESVISVCTLDKEIDEKVTFLKMDIEGAELDALKGATETIKKYRPKLAICVYHKIDDIINIPQYILQINKGYKLYLRHYSDNIGETVLYAI